MLYATYDLLPAAANSMEQGSMAFLVFPSKRRWQPSIRSPCGSDVGDLDGDIHQFSSGFVG